MQGLISPFYIVYVRVNLYVRVTPLVGVNPNHRGSICTRSQAVYVQWRVIYRGRQFRGLRITSAGVLHGPNVSSSPEKHYPRSDILLVTEWSGKTHSTFLVPTRGTLSHGHKDPPAVQTIDASSRQNRDFLGSCTRWDIRLVNIWRNRGPENAPAMFALSLRPNYRH